MRGNGARLTVIAACMAAVCLQTSTGLAQRRDSFDRAEVIGRTMKPYAGPVKKGVDTSTLTGTVMCGYQGWFTCPGDGAESGWFHWAGARGEFKPGVCSIDFWPDVSECDPDELCPTDFRLADGSVAHVFSSQNKKTVLRHFKWMEDYGIDGVFVQRFAVQAFSARALNLTNTVLNHCREGANTFGRAYAVMYDLSGLRDGQMEQVIEDWKLLRGTMKITDDPAYLHHRGKPVVSVWGLGFNDNRRYSLEECAVLVDFLKNDPEYGGCTVMLGVPTWWRTLDHDTMPDPLLHEIIKAADIVSPWMVGRFRSISDVATFSRDVWAGDFAWCAANRLEYLPVVFPGFSWKNMNPRTPQPLIPRLGGRFLWAQYDEFKRLGATMMYQAMFDEVDEGTAIFKCTNNPPVGESTFLTYEGRPSDHYLWLVGQAGRVLRGERAASAELPMRETR